MKVAGISTYKHVLSHTACEKNNAANEAVSKKYDYRFYQYPKASAQVNFAGRIRCDFLDSKQISLITNSIINRFSDISSVDIRKYISIIRKTMPNFGEEEFVRNIAAKCEFCNIKDFDKVLEYIREGHFQLLAVDDLGIGNSLAYLQTKRNPAVRVKISTTTLKDLPQKIVSMKKKNPAIILSNFSIENLTEMAENSPRDFLKIIKYGNFLYPHGSINGVNAFSLSGVEELVEKGLYPECDERIIEKFLKLCKKTIEQTAPEERIELKFHDIRNLMPYSIDAIINRLRYRHRFFQTHDETFMPMARLMRKFQKDSGCNLFGTNLGEEIELFRDALLRHSTMYTPIQLNRSLKTLHSKIQAITKDADVVYYLPKSASPKSFNYIISSFFLTNGIPQEKLIKDASKILPTQKVVILDDYIGSGQSMAEQFDILSKNGINKENIIIASIAATKRGYETLKGKVSNLITDKIISDFDITKTAIYKRIPNEKDRKKLLSAAKESLIGGYNDGVDNFSTFYMTPNNNNNLFFANIAPGFVVSSYGIKAAFNTFDKTVRKADLTSLTQHELNEIISIYKKANAIIPECIIRKISQLTPDNSENLISVLNTLGKMNNPQIAPDIAIYLKKALADIDVKKVDNIFLIDNIMDVCKLLGTEPPIKFIAQMINELQNPKTKVSVDVLLHFYLKMIDKLYPIKEVNARIVQMINNLTPQQMAKFNILEDVMKIAERNYFSLPKNVIKRINEIVEGIEQNGISLELLTSILKTSQIDSNILNKAALKRWWEKIPQQIKEKTDSAVSSYFEDTVPAIAGGSHVSK